MQNKLKVICIPGSLSERSINTELLLLASRILNDLLTVQIVKLSEMNIPLFNHDLIGTDQSKKLLSDVIFLKRNIASAHAILISSPEYNNSVTGVLKNVIDWVSVNLQLPEVPNNPIYRKVVGLMSASPGMFGGIRCIMHLREIVMALGAIMMPEYLCSPNVYEMTEQKEARVKEYALKFYEFISIYHRL